MTFHFNFLTFYVFCIHPYQEVIQEYLKTVKLDLETRADSCQFPLKTSSLTSITVDKQLQVSIQKPILDKAIQASLVQVLKDQQIQVDKTEFSRTQETQVEPELFETGVRTQANFGDIQAAKRKNLLYAEKEVQADVDDCEKSLETQVTDEALGLSKEDVEAAFKKNFVMERRRLMLSLTELTSCPKFARLHGSNNVDGQRSTVWHACP